jgi:enterochelin esterase-like enzyme
LIVVGVSFLILRRDSGTTKSYVHSAGLGRDMAIEVFTPTGTHCSSAPVLLLFHGRGGDERQWLEGAPFDGIGIDATARRLIESGDIAPVTIVSASIDDSYGVDSPAADDAYDHGPYESYIVDELIPAVAQRYGSGGQSPMFIGGVSMGGYAALNVAFRHPGMFAGVGALSPAFFVAPPREREWMYTSDDGRSLLELAAGGDADGMRLFLGRGDHDYDWIIKATDRLDEALAARSVEHEAVVAPGGHDAGTWRALSEPMLTHLFGWQSADC